MPETMRIWQYSTLDRDLEDCLTLKEDAPIPSKSSLRKNELLVEVIRASLNPADYKVPATPVIGRLMVSRPATPGMDFCGRVAGKHPSNTAFEEGQIVFGGLAMINQRGVLGQFIVIDGSVCAALPKGIDPDQGASVGTAATTAYQSLMPDKLKPGAKVFINGGSGGTGTWGIQIAKALGAEVVTTCSTANVDLCRQLGADEVIDYKTEDVLTNLKARGNVFDLVIDNVGSTAGLYDNCSHYLKKRGTFVLVGVGPNMTLSGIFWTLARQVHPTVLGGGGFYFVQQKNTTDYFQRLGKWMTEAKMKAVIDSEFAFEDVPEAYRKLREGRAKGKIVVHVGSRGDAA